MADTVQQLIAEKIGKNTTPKENPITSTVGTSATRILSNNPRRVAFVLINLGSYPIYLSPSNDPSTTKGIYIAESGGQISLNYENDFELTGGEFWAVADGGNSEIYVLSEELYG